MLIFVLVLCAVISIVFLNIYLTAIFDKNGFCGYIRILFFRFYFPKKKNIEKNISKKSDGKNKKPGKLKELRLIIDPAFRAIGKFVRYLCIRNLYMDITIGTGDAFSTAMMYGGAAAGIGMIFPVLYQNLNIKRKCINVMADFDAEESTAYMDVTVSVRIWQMLAVAVVFLIGYIKKTIYKRKDDKNG